MTEYTVLFEEGLSSWGASVPDLPGCFAIGETYQEAEKLIRDAIEVYMEELRGSGEPVPPPAHKSALVSVVG